MNTNDFNDWKRHPVTQIIFNQLENRIKDLQEILGEQAGKDIREDILFVGAIKAYQDIIRIEWEEDKEATE